MSEVSGTATDCHKNGRWTQDEKDKFVEGKYEILVNKWLVKFQI